MERLDTVVSPVSRHPFSSLNYLNIPNTGYLPLTDKERQADKKGEFRWRESVLIRFVFITRAFNDYVKNAFDILTQDFFPDVVCINSTFWDISRWDEHGHEKDREGRTFYPRLEQNVDNLTRHVNKAEMNALKL